MYKRPKKMYKRPKARRISTTRWISPSKSMSWVEYESLNSEPPLTLDELASCEEGYRLWEEELEEEIANGNQDKIDEVLENGK